jgi:hypothetical protein
LWQLAAFNNKEVRSSLSGSTAQGGIESAADLLLLLLLILLLLLHEISNVPVTFQTLGLVHAPNMLHMSPCAALVAHRHGSMCRTGRTQAWRCTQSSLDDVKNMLAKNVSCLVTALC